MKEEEQKRISFNHGRLCEMLRAASDEELANVINDVQKIQKQRDIARKQMYSTSIRNLIAAAIQDGYMVTITTSDDLAHPVCIIHSNNILCSTVGIVTVEEDE